MSVGCSATIGYGYVWKHGNDILRKLRDKHNEDFDDKHGIEINGRSILIPESIISTRVDDPEAIEPSGMTIVKSENFEPDFHDMEWDQRLNRFAAKFNLFDDGCIPFPRWWLLASFC